MAFTVENGSGVESANSYVALEYATAFHTDRNNAGWTGTDAVKQAALIKATDYIEAEYSQRFKGYMSDDSQSLSWPRTDVPGVVGTEIPDRLKQAVCILALEALTVDINAPVGRAVKREKVDVVEVEYMDDAKDSVRRPAIDGLLRAYLSGSRHMAEVVRV